MNVSSTSTKRNLQHNVSIVAATVTGAFIFVSTLMITSFLVGLVCGAKIMEKRIRSKELRYREQRNNTGNSEFRMYEELQYVEKPTFEVSQNVAYGNIQNL